MKQLITAFLICAGLCPLSASAGLFDKKPKVDPGKRVPELLQALAGARQVGQRLRAAEELRDFDGGQFPEIVPSLILAIEKDTSANVRREAVQSLAKIKPASREALHALETAADKDPSLLVRVQAKTVKLTYRVAEGKPPEGGIPVPPPGPDGRLKPIPVPDIPKPGPAEPLPSPMPQPKPPAGAPGPKLVPPPPAPEPIKVTPVANPKPAETGPILLPPTP